MGETRRSHSVDDGWLMRGRIERGLQQRGNNEGRWYGSGVKPGP